MCRTDLTFSFRLGVLLSFIFVTACSSDSSSNQNGDGTSLDAADSNLDFPSLGDNGTEDTVHIDGLRPDLSTDTPVEDTTVDLNFDTAIDTFNSETAGQPCFDQRDCDGEEICVGSDPTAGIEGYCTMLDCTSHAQCNFGNEDQLFCCSDFGNYRGCFLEAESVETCGAGEGEQDFDCSTGGQSDCLGTRFYCIELYGDSLCAGICDPYARPDEPGSCEEDHWCIVTGGGGGLCIPSGDTAVREPCDQDPSSCGEGMLCSGGFQDPPLPFSHCTRSCTRDRDCEEDEWCQSWPGQGQGACTLIGDVPEGGSCAEDRWSCQEDLFCVSEGTQYATCTSACLDNSDCEDDYFCSMFDTFGVCQLEGDRDNGEPCGDDPRACNPDGACYAGWSAGYNPDAYCADSCNGMDTSCDGDAFCQDFGEAGAYCLADGSNEAGDECERAVDCERDTYCIFNTEEEPGFCALSCEGDRQCLESEWCTGSPGAPGVCLPFGEIDPPDSCDDERLSCAVGSICAGSEPICIADCTEDEDACPDDTYCTEPDTNEQRSCLPFGEAATGEPCDGAFACEPGSSCLLSEATGTGICSHDCVYDSDCPGTMWCLRDTWSSWCLPGGEATDGEPCGEDRMNCAVGFVCAYAGTDQNYCAEVCTGYADRCEEGQTCRYMGWGLNLCAAIGELETGDDCSEDLGACDSENICLDASTEDAFCAQICSFDSDLCEDGTECRHFRNGFAACVPPGFEGGFPG